jgi:hypothetical protein
MSQLAMAEAKRVVALSGDGPRYKTAVGIVNAMLGKQDEARIILGELDQVSQPQICHNTFLFLRRYSFAPRRARTGL